jgi:membrane protease YdiL (CAAX protease family)
MAISVVMTWVFNRTGESLPVQMILHASINNFASVVWVAMFPTVTAHATVSRAIMVAAVGSALVVLALTRGRLDAPR